MARAQRTEEFGVDGSTGELIPPAPTGGETATQRQRKSPVDRAKVYVARARRACQDLGEVTGLTEAQANNAVDLIVKAAESARQTLLAKLAKPADDEIDLG